MNAHYLQDTMENFYLCSHLPICAFNKNGDELLTAGFLPNMAHLAIDTPIWLKEAQLTLQEQEHLTFTPKESIHFTLCPINPDDIEEGIYLIGPYTSSKHLMEDFPFKPAHCIPHLITLLYTLAEAQLETASSSAALHDDYSYHIIKAEEYIHTHFREPITLEALAKYLNLNKSYLCTIFKKATKDSFCNYTNKVRIEESKKLLLNTNEPMIDIALAVGFSSASYFNTIFKKVEGKTPLEYRKNA
ncbi:MAG: AraC family transcriptional regulator [Candidatus Cellulosilyticum pullistercoris]|uniref:AraC family transcriptional regulator n=1 Tax=Candidatus Cellulosilyticum pullistercoris TaxID=2838521 RepID=A0A9E2KBF7_9FIRM|nr:AraC family transcriptional regulator [Candidatus Cellulosilyticum pullistercoris]